MTPGGAISAETDEAWETDDFNDACGVNQRLLSSRVNPI
ncbi:protein of unknown function [Ruminococcaceae bacterium BL-6]|nr:protein of unknown function [Ruminococcaceae bacterium BL-6]